MTSQADGKVPTRERAISLILLAGLGMFVFLIVGRGLLRGPVVSPGSDAPAGTVYTLPEGWELAGAWEVYPSGRFYEKINGREPLFQEYGAVRLEYASASFGGDGFEIYVYRMKDADGALGVYLANQPSEFEELTLGAMADISGGQARAFQGRTYVEILSLAREADRERLIGLTAHILKQTADEGKTSKGAFEIFPADGRIRGTLSLNRENTFGLKSLTNTFTVSYEAEDVFFDYLIRRLTSEEDGETILKAVGEELTEFDGKEIERRRGGLSAEFMGKRMILERKGAMLFGIYGRMSEAEARSKLDLLIRRSGEKAKANGTE